MNEIAPEFAVAVNDPANPTPIVNTSDVIQWREDRAKHLQGRRYLMPLQGKAIAEVVEKDVQVEMKDGAKIRVRVYTPNSGTVKPEERALILMYHEGGFQFGDLTDEEMNCRLFTRDFGAVCVNVEYRWVSSLSPGPLSTSIWQGCPSLMSMCLHGTRSCWCSPFRIPRCIGDILTVFAGSVQKRCSQLGFLTL